MAEGRGRGGRAKPAPAPKQKTRYIVLERVVLPAGDDSAHPAAAVAWRPILAKKAEEGTDGEPRIFETGNDSQAIRAYTGDGPDAIEGTFRAVAERAWKGGETITRTTAAKREAID